MTTLLGRTRWQRRIAVPKQGPVARMAFQPAGQAHGMRFSEWLLMGVLCVAYLLSVSEPLFNIQLHRTILNHFPLVLLMPVMVLHMFSIAFNPRPAARGAILATCWPLVLLATYALVGSLFARFQFKVPDSYVTFGFYLMLLPFWAAAAPTEPARVASWVRALVTVWFVFSLMALVGEVARVQSRETLHEIEYLVISGFFVVFCVARSTAVKVLMLILMLAAAGINQKLTGYIIAALAVMHIVFVSGWSRSSARWRSTFAVVAAVMSVLIVVTLAVLYFAYRDYLPSGNANVRLKQYEAAWLQFLDSPVWGHAYLKGSGEDYIESFRVFSLPTHSDVLDVLKHGGAVGMLLFAWGYWKIFSLLNRAIAATQGDRLLHGYFTAVRFFQITALVTFSINPVLLKGPFDIVIWGNLGLAVGLALAVGRNPVVDDQA